MIAHFYPQKDLDASTCQLFINDPLRSFDLRQGRGEFKVGNTVKQEYTVRRNQLFTSQGRVREKTMERMYIDLKDQDRNLCYLEANGVYKPVYKKVRPVDEDDKTESVPRGHRD